MFLLARGGSQRKSLLKGDPSFERPHIQQTVSLVGRQWPAFRGVGWFVTDNGVSRPMHVCA